MSQEETCILQTPSDTRSTHLTNPLLLALSHTPLLWVRGNLALWTIFTPITSSIPYQAPGEAQDPYWFSFHLGAPEIQKHLTKCMHLQKTQGSSPNSREFKKKRHEKFYCSPKQTSFLIRQCLLNSNIIFVPNFGDSVRKCQVLHYPAIPVTYSAPGILSAEP